MTYRPPFRYKLHRILPMRLIEGIESRLRSRYHHTRSDWSRRWLDRLVWFTTPYRGAQLGSGHVDGMEGFRETMRYGLYDHGTQNVRWEMYRAKGGPMAAIGLTGGTYGRRIKP